VAVAALPGEVDIAVEADARYPPVGPPVSVVTRPGDGPATGATLGKRKLTASSSQHARYTMEEIRGAMADMNRVGLDRLRTDAQRSSPAPLQSRERSSAFFEANSWSERMPF
jgi:hypothetical protein